MKHAAHLSWWQEVVFSQILPCRFDADSFLLRQSQEEGTCIRVSLLSSLSSCKASWRPTSRRSSSACQVRSRTSCRTGKPRTEVTASRGHPRRTRRCQRRTERGRRESVEQSCRRTREGENTKTVNLIFKGQML